MVSHHQPAGSQHHQGWTGTPSTHLMVLFALVRSSLLSSQHVFHLCVSESDLSTWILRNDGEESERMIEALSENRRRLTQT